MSESKKKYPWLSSKTNQARTLVEKAKREVPGFKEHYGKFEEQATIGGYSESTLYNYSRAVARISLHFKKSLLELKSHQKRALKYAIHHPGILTIIRTDTTQIY